MHEFGTGGSGVPYLGPEILTFDLTAAAEVRAFRIDSGHPPIATRTACAARDTIYGIGVIAVHVLEDRRLGRRERARITCQQNLAGFDPTNAAEPSDQMRALDAHAIQPEVAEAGIHLGRRMAPGEARQQPRVDYGIGAAGKARARAGQGIVEAGCAIDQKRETR